MTTDRVDIRIDVQQQGAEALERINQEVGELSQSAAQTGIAFDRIQQDIREATIAIEQGAISSEDYAQALRFARQEANQLGISSDRLESSIKGIQGRFRGTARETLPQFIRRTEGAAVGMQKVNVAAQRTARQGLGTIRSSLASLTATTIGTSGTLGTLGGALLQFAAGNAIAVGAVAGLAAIAFAFRKLTSDAREAKKKIDESIESADELIKRQAGPLAQLVPQLVNVRGQGVQLDEQLRKAQARVDDPGRFVIATTRGQQTITASTIRARAETEIEELTAKIVENREREAAVLREIASIEGPKADAVRSKTIGALQQGLELGILTTKHQETAGDIERVISEQLRDKNLLLEREIELRKQLVSIQQVTQVGIEAALEFGEKAFALAIKEASAAALAGIPSSITPQEAGTFSAAAGLQSRQDAVIQARQEASRQAFQEANAAAAQFALAVIESTITPRERIAADIAALEAALPGAGEAAGEMAKAIEILKVRLGETATEAEFAAARMVIAFGQMAEQAIRALQGRGGGLFGFLGGAANIAGGIISVANPLAGASILAGSGVLSALSRSERPRVIVDEYGSRAQQQRRETRQGPDTIIVQLLDAQGRPIREIAADLADLERRDGINRFSGTVQGAVTRTIVVG